MNNFFFFLLHNRECRRIKKGYNQIFNNYFKAYQYWGHLKFKEDDAHKEFVVHFNHDSIEYKRYVVDHIEEIISIQKSFNEAKQETEQLKKEAQDGFIRFIYELCTGYGKKWYSSSEWHLKYTVFKDPEGWMYNPICRPSHLKSSDRFRNSDVTEDDIAYYNSRKKKTYSKEEVLGDPYEFLFYKSNLDVAYLPSFWNFSIYERDIYGKFKDSFKREERIDFEIYINKIIYKNKQVILNYQKIEDIFYQLEKSHKDSIQYYLKGEDIHDYINHGKVVRNQQVILQIAPLLERVRELQLKYPKGFNAICENKDLLSGSITILQEIIELENEIEYEHIKITNQIKSNLKNKVSRWMRLGGSIPYYHLFNYFPKRFTEISDSSKRIREAIWRFKDGIETVPWVEYLHKVLSDVFTYEELKILTFVPVPASSIHSNNMRYKSFAQSVSETIGLANGFNHIKLSGSRDAKHLNEGNTEKGDYSIALDNEYFRDRCVVLFDDIVTSGSSMLQMKELMEEAGAQVICAVSLGKTFSHGANASLPHPYDGDCQFY